MSIWINDKEICCEGIKLSDCGDEIIAQVVFDDLVAAELAELIGG